MAGYRPAGARRLLRTALRPLPRGENDTRLREARIALVVMKTGRRRSSNFGHRSISFHLISGFRARDEYQLSLMNPHGRKTRCIMANVLQIREDAQCDKLATELS